MKKILLFVSAVAMMLSAGSCQKEIEYLDGDTNVTFEVSTGDLTTKAIADASNITVLHWELYGSDIRTAAAPYGEGTVTDTDGDKHFTVNLRLVADQDYNIVFWAETEDGLVAMMYRLLFGQSFGSMPRPPSPRPSRTLMPP